VLLLLPFFLTTLVVLHIEGESSGAVILMVSDIDIGISVEQRAAIAQGLARVLADSTLLYAKTHGFHWNVTGPMFNTLHLMFMDQYTELWNALDGIALADQANDQPTADLLTQRLQIHEKTAWMLRSLLDS
jgi:starvation-inducible DNA-binding protein